MRTFKARWDTPVKLITASIIAVGLVSLFFEGARLVGWGLLSTSALCAVLGVYGYSLDGRELLVHRLGWTTRIDLSELEAVQVNPMAMTGSLRLFGIGGLFGYIGRFRNSSLGNYRAYATSRRDAVVLGLNKGPVVVSPEAPYVFAEALEEARG